MSLVHNDFHQLITYCAKSKNKYILVVDTSDWVKLSDDKKTEVRDFYEEDIIPLAESILIFNNDLIFFEFPTQQGAVDTAFDWFPLSTQLDDPDYFIECYVVTPAGGIPYCNRTQQRPSES